MHMEKTPTLIVGAGPTGLATALFLAKRGIRSRLVDKSETASQTSRAQVVNPRTLELLNDTGLTDAIVSEGRAIHGVKFYEAWKPLAALEFKELPSKYSMTVIPQARTEVLLSDALDRIGIAAERGKCLDKLNQTDDHVEATFNGQLSETISARFVLGADGAHSTVRSALGIEFAGHGFPETWPLYDIHLADPLDLDHAHVSFFEEGLVFMLGITPGLWRVFSNLFDPLTLLPAGSSPGAIDWQSSFHIGDKQANRLVEGRVALAGDAAHIHSPIGARGMNLGIEDAYVFSACVADALAGDMSRFDQYHDLRHPVHAKVVSRMDRLTTLARGKPGWLGLLRNHLIPAVASFGPLAHVMQDFVTGLDEPIRTR
jgi:2-polyprenyl-6-methoxyphenol hydroxylase-like FAD-dependent oxidoreductase